jgi:hypothetical protein
MTVTTIAILALVATLISLAWGVGSMAHGGKWDDDHSTQLMSMRVGFQLLAFVLILVVLLTA